MTPEQLEELKKYAQEQNGKEVKVMAVGPAAILSLIAQVEALTVPQGAPSAIVDAYGAFAGFQAWAADNLGQGYSLAMEDHTFIDPVTRWAFAGYRAGLKAAQSDAGITASVPLVESPENEQKRAGTRMDAEAGGAAQIVKSVDLACSSCGLTMAQSRALAAPTIPAIPGTKEDAPCQK